MPPQGPWDPPQPDQYEGGQDEAPGQATHGAGPSWGVNNRLLLVVAGVLVGALLLGLLFFAIRDRGDDQPASTSDAKARADARAGAGAGALSRGA